MELYILALAGALLHMFFKFQNAQKRKAFFQWENQIMAFIGSMVAVSVLIYVRDDISSIIEINRITAVFIGYAGDSLFKNLFKQFQKKITL